MTHDYQRHDTIHLYAALNIVTGKMLTDCRERHTAKDFVRFLRLIDRNVPAALDVHLVLDNLSAHKAPEVQAWLAHPQRRRFHMHFTPTSSSWVNLVERWFKELTDKRLRRGTFNSGPALVEGIELWVAHWNDDPRPLVWHTPAADIIAKVRRGRAALAQLDSPTDH
jgi:transposase